MRDGLLAHDGPDELTASLQKLGLVNSARKTANTPHGRSERIDANAHESPFYGPEFYCGVSAQEIGHRLIEPALATSIDRCGQASDGYSTVHRVQVYLRDAVVKIFNRIRDFVVISNPTSRILYIDESFNFSCSDSEWNWSG
jgi:hypothetical protein